MPQTKVSTVPNLRCSQLQVELSTPTGAVFFCWVPSTPLWWPHSCMKKKNRWALQILCLTITATCLKAAGRWLQLLHWSAGLDCSIHWPQMNIGFFFTHLGGHKLGFSIEQPKLQGKPKAAAVALDCLSITLLTDWIEKQLDPWSLIVKTGYRSCPVHRIKIPDSIGQHWFQSACPWWSGMGIFESGIS